MGVRRLRNVLPLIGLPVAIILNAAWMGFLGYTLFKVLTGLSSCCSANAVPGLCAAPGSSAMSPHAHASSLVDGSSSLLMHAQDISEGVQTSMLSSYLHRFHRAVTLIVPWLDSRQSIAVSRRVWKLICSSVFTVGAAMKGCPASVRLHQMQTSHSRIGRGKAIDSFRECLSQAVGRQCRFSRSNTLRPIVIVIRSILASIE